MSTTHKEATRNAIADLVTALVDAGSGNGELVLRVQNSTVDSPATEVATLTFSATAFGAASGGTCTAATITEDSNATGGIPLFATLQDSDANIVAHCSAGGPLSGADILLSTSEAVVAGATVKMSALTYSAGA